MTTPGYHGRALVVDATDASAAVRILPDDLLRGYLGGSGLGTRLLLDMGAAKLSPFEPASPLVFAFSPLVGSPLTTSAKFAVVHKSPLTERINDSLASSGFAIRGKCAAGDALVIVGRAPRLSILIVDDGHAPGIFPRLDWFRPWVCVQIRLPIRRASRRAVRAEPNP